MQYKDFRPTIFDPAGAFLDDDRQDWHVAPVSRTRDSGPREESNFEAALGMLGGESDTVEVLRFGHWGPGWFEIILVHPDRAQEVEKLQEQLEDYPVLDENDLCEREHAEANRIWKGCYTAQERLAYIRAHRSQFEFRGFADLLGCVRGEYFAGYDSELIG